MPGLSLTMSFFILCMTVVILLFNAAQTQMNVNQSNYSKYILNASALSTNDQLHIEPFPIDIKIPAHTMIPPFGLQITSKKNITNVETHFSDLIADKANSLWIPRNKIVMNPRAFDVVEGKITDVSLLLNISNYTGSYHGSMTLSYPGGISRYQITVNIFEDALLYLYIVIVLGLGVLTAFFVRLIRIQNESRQDALDSFNESRSEMVDAHTNDRLSTEFDSGISKFFQGLQMLEQGFFVNAKESFEAAAQLFKSAKKIPSVESEIQKPNYEIPAESKILAVARNISGKGLTRSLRQDNAILYLVTSILLFIGIIELWFTILPKLLPLSNSIFLYLSTFLTGYGSQSVLGEIVEFARRR